MFFFGWKEGKEILFVFVFLFIYSCFFFFFFVSFYVSCFLVFSNRIGFNPLKTDVHWKVVRSLAKLNLCSMMAFLVSPGIKGLKLYYNVIVFLLLL